MSGAADQARTAYSAAEAGARATSRGLLSRGPLSCGPLNRSLVTSLVAAGTARAAYVLLKARPPGGAQSWHRTNHRGEPVTLLEGPAAAVGAVAAVATAAGVPARARAAAAVAGVGAAAFGGYDDLAGSGDRRGFRGHLGALRQGNVTTGAVKLGGIGATGAAAAAMLGGPPVDVVINSGLVAASANLLNLFDLRPGRAIKVALAAAALCRFARRSCPRPPRRRGSAAGLLGEDLGERAMLGDAGANALGAVLGVAAAASLPRGARLAVLAGDHGPHRGKRGRQLYQGDRADGAAALARHDGQAPAHNRPRPHPPPPRRPARGRYPAATRPPIRPPIGRPSPAGPPSANGRRARAPGVLAPAGSAAQAAATGSGAVGYARPGATLLPRTPGDARSPGAPRNSGGALGGYGV